MVNIIPNTYSEYAINGWTRCKKLKTDVNSNMCYMNISAFDLNNLLMEYKDLIFYWENVIDDINEYMDLFLSVMLVSKDGYILRQKKNKKYEKTLDSVMNLKLGGRFTEKYNGNTAISSSIIENKPICIIGKEHYCKVYFEYSTLSAPIYNNGEIIGTLSAIGLDSISEYQSMGLIVAAAKAISIQSEFDKLNKQVMKENKYKNAIVDTLTDGVLTVDKDGFVTFLNQVGAEILCVDRESSMGKHISDIVDFKPVVLDVLKTGKGYIDKEFLVTKKTGEKIHFIKTAVPLLDEYGNITAVVDTFRKIKRINKLLNELNGFYANFTFNDIIGSSNKIKDCIKKSKNIACSVSNVLVTGESGTGKELIAQAIHNHSDRKSQPFVTINCGAIPRELLESELFGYEPGSFTGASIKGRMGKFELANGGTIFLDEIGEMPIDMQVKLLRVIQDKKVTRIGGNHVFDLDVRIISATNKDLLELCKSKGFREDLYYRINVLHVELPPLRNRKEDIRELIQHFIGKLSIKLDKEVRDISPEAMEKIMSYNWPGNVRELENKIERAVNLCDGQIIKSEDIYMEDFGIDSNYTDKGNTVYDDSNHSNEESIEPLEIVEKRIIEKALHKTDGNITATANLLKVTRNTVYNKIKKYNLISVE